MSEDLEPLSPEEGVERFIRQREDSVRPSTLSNAKTRLRYFLDWCGEREIENLNTLSGRDLADFVAWRRGEIAAITLQKQLSTIRVALRYWSDIEGVADGLAEKVNAPELPDGAEARDEHITASEAEALLTYLDSHHYASRDHVVILLLWRSGMRRGALRSIDVDDLRPEDHAIVLEHRPERGTKLKNGDDGNRWVYLGPKWFQPIDDYLDNPDRHAVTDDHGREPLITTRYGRPTGDTIYSWVNRITQPCTYSDHCPHDREIESCEHRQHDGYPSQCPSSIHPHGIRRGALTDHLNEDVSPEIVSERCDVSLDVLYQHYDVRTDREKMSVRKRQLEEM